MARWQRFKVIKPLGSGAFGKTLLVEDQERNNRRVVLKVPHDKDREEALMRELMTGTALRASLQGISHPNIVQYIDLARFEDYFVIILEYVEGSDLRARIGPAKSVRTPMPVGEAVGLAVQMCAGLAAAHGVGLVHRDIKPENILLRDEDGTVKLADFGISKIMQSTGASGAGTVVGTPYYMAPEAWLGRADACSDIWSLSVMLYEMVTGRIPFVAENIIELKEKIDREVPPAPSRLNRKVDEKLDRVIMRGLEKDPSRRFPNVEAMSLALRPQPEAAPRPVAVPAGPAPAEPAAGAAQGRGATPAAAVRLDVAIEAALRLFQDGREAEAERQLTELERQFPTEATIFLALGQLHSRRDRFAAAEEVYRRGVRACPEHASLTLALAMVLLKQRGDKAAEGAEYANKALKLGLKPGQERSARALLRQWEAEGGIR